MIIREVSAATFYRNFLSTDFDAYLFIGWVSQTCLFVYPRNII
jgi:hypothetical protein